MKIQSKICGKIPTVNKFTEVYLIIWGYSGNAADMMNKIKQQFDPQNILNPQRYLH